MVLEMPMLGKVDFGFVHCYFSELLVNTIVAFLILLQRLDGYMSDGSYQNI